jgi:hypothetical protein
VKTAERMRSLEGYVAIVKAIMNGEGTFDAEPEFERIRQGWEVFQQERIPNENGTASTQLCIV